MKFIVDRTKWYRGHGGEESYLLSTHDKLCCVGFVGQQCGVPDAMLDEISCVDPEIVEHKKFPKWMFENPSGYGSVMNAIAKAYDINDDEEITDEEREKRLKALFLENGDEIEFIN